MNSEFGRVESRRSFRSTAEVVVDRTFEVDRIDPTDAIERRLIDFFAHEPLTPPPLAMTPNFANESFSHAVGEPTLESLGRRQANAARPDTLVESLDRIGSNGRVRTAGPSEPRRSFPAAVVTAAIVFAVVPGLFESGTKQIGSRSIDRSISTESLDDVDLGDSWSSWDVDDDRFDEPNSFGDSNDASLITYCSTKFDDARYRLRVVRRRETLEPEHVATAIGAFEKKAEIRWTEMTLVDELTLDTFNRSEPELVVVFRPSRTKAKTEQAGARPN
jgi:hypothetical protein